MNGLMLEVEFGDDPLKNNFQRCSISLIPTLIIFKPASELSSKFVK